jgi:hypothetical protein
MKTPTRASLSIALSSVALAAAISAPSAFAEERHGGGGHGRGSDDVVSTAMTTASPRVDVRHDDAVNDHDLNDDRGIDLVNGVVVDDDD